VFGHTRNAVTILAAGGGAREVPEGTKESVADAVWDEVARLWTPAGGPAATPVE
jgi:phosphopantothenoylcysteine synthetase/decarboxylase